MAVTLEILIGFETGGLEEAASVVGLPDATEAVIVHTGGSTRSLKMAGAATAPVYTTPLLTAINDVAMGVAIYFNNITPTNDVDIIEFGGGFTGVKLRFEATSGDLIIVDADGAEQGSVSAPFTINTMHFLECYVDGNNTNGTVTVHLDGSEIVSSTGIDTSQGASGFTVCTHMIFMGGTVSGEDIYFDDFYLLGGVTGISDFLGNFVIKPYQNTAEDATDQGDTLADGTWALVSETPGNSGTSNDAQYVDTGNLTGSTIMDEGDRAGPSGDSDVTGATIKGAKFISNLKRGTGAGRVHTILYGNSGDGVTATADLGLTTDYIIYEVLSESASIIPTESESFQMGFSKSATAGEDIFCGDQWAMLGYVPSVGPIPVINLVMAPYIPA